MVVCFRAETATSKLVGRVRHNDNVIVNRFLSAGDDAFYLENGEIKPIYGHCPAVRERLVPHLSRCQHSCRYHVTLCVLPAIVVLSYQTRATAQSSEARNFGWTEDEPLTT